MLEHLDRVVDRVHRRQRIVDQAIEQEVTEARGVRRFSQPQQVLAELCRRQQSGVVMREHPARPDDDVELGLLQLLGTFGRNADGVGDHIQI